MVERNMCNAAMRGIVVPPGSRAQALDHIRQAFAGWTRGGSRMRESCRYGSERGARGNSRPYRDSLLQCIMSAPVQVFGRRQRRPNHTLGRGASEKRQGTKSREGGARLGRAASSAMGI